MTHSSSQENHSTDDEQADNDFGRLLAEARKARNFTVDEVSEHLKIPARTITALEASDKEALPASTFTQGYIRAYAKFLEMSEDEVLAVYNRAVPHEDASDLKPRSKLPDEASSQSPLVKAFTVLLIITIIAVIGFGGFRYYQNKADAMESALDAKQQRFTGNSLDSPSGQPLAIKQNARMVDGELVVGKVAAYEPATEEVETDEATPEAATVEAEKKSEAINIEAEQPETTSDAVNENDTIEIIAENGSWVEVRDANKSRLLYNMLPAGGSRVLVGHAPFSVTMGNAKTTRVVVNDIEIDVSDYIRSNNTASFKVSTQGQDIVFH